jgi:hypothetical protein
MKLCTYSSPLPPCYMPHSSHPPSFEHPNNIWWTLNFEAPHCAVFFTFVLLRYKYSPQHPVLKHPQSIHRLRMMQLAGFVYTQNSSWNISTSLSSMNCKYPTSVTELSITKICK